MKILYSIILLCVIILLISCMGPNGPDGQDGTAYVAINDYDGYTYSYSDNNPNTPYSGYYGHYYQSDDGFFSFEYESRIYYETYYLFSIWSGTYQIWIHYGEKGGEGKIFWQEGEPGKDGEDSYLDLYLSYDGPFIDRLNKDSLNKNTNDNGKIFYIGDYAIKLTYTQISSGRFDYDNVEIIPKKNYNKFKAE